MIAYNCLLCRGMDFRTWICGDCVMADSPEDAASRYLRTIWKDNPLDVEHEVPVLVRVVDGDDVSHDFHVTPKFSVKFDVEQWPQP